MCITLILCRLGSVVEQLFRKQQVTGSNPVVGLPNFTTPITCIVKLLTLRLKDKRLSFYAFSNSG